jgi:hypothetical protein
MNIFLPELLTPGLNQWERMHWRAREQWKKRCVEYITAYAQDRPQFADKVRITYGRCRRAGAKDMDDDNLYGSFKPLGDALQRLGIIADDGPDHVELVCKQQRVGHGGDWGTWIHIEPENQR